MLVPSVGVGVFFCGGLGLDGLEGLDIGLGRCVSIQDIMLDEVVLSIIELQGHEAKVESEVRKAHKVFSSFDGVLRRSETRTNCISS